MTQLENTGGSVDGGANPTPIGNAREDIKEIRDILCIKQPNQEGF